MENKAEREKFTTTLNTDVIRKLNIIAAYNNKYRNDIIELLVAKEWEDNFNEMETKTGHRRKGNTRVSK